MSEKREVRGIWKYLHHMLSGFILLFEGILLLFWRQPIGFVLLFIFIGGFLFVDDILAELKESPYLKTFIPIPLD